jgi:cytochrome c-type biogenesis protein
MELFGMASLSFAAGLLSFTSPCCLPLMPGYVSYISSAAGDGVVAAANPSRTRALWTALLFVTGFAVVFITLGASASALSGALLANRVVLSRLGGVVIIAMGLLLAGVIRVPVLMREVRFDLSKIRPGPAGAVPLGMAFAIGWVPCVGPVLAGILTLAASNASLAQGALLLAVYSLGLAVPFVGLAVGASRVTPVVRWLKRHARGVELSGAAVLILMGVLLVTDLWTRFFTPLTTLFTESGWPPL